MNFLTKGGRQQCPVEGFPGVSETRAAMRVHFLHRHVHDTVVILEEGNPPPTMVPPVRPQGPKADHTGKDREREWRAGSVGRKSRPDPCRVT